MAKATICKSAQKKSLFKRGDLVEASSAGLVLCTGSETDNLFSGVTLSEGEGGYPIGYYSKDWNKESFTLFRGSVTLTED